MSQARGNDLFSSELQLENYIVGHPELLDFLLVRQSPGTLRHGWLDLLGMDDKATLDDVELKLHSTCGNTMGQVMDYAHWMQSLTMNDVVDLAAGGENPVDLPAAFEKRFGRPLPARLGGRPRTTVIAARFDRRTIHGIEYLQGEGVRIRALRWVVTRGSIELRPFSVEDQEREDFAARQERHHAGATRVVPKRTEAPWTPIRHTPHADVAEFWTRFSPQFVWEFIPTSLAFALYERWRRQEALLGQARKPFARSHFTRHVNLRSYEIGGWRYRTQLRVGALLDAREPLVDGLTWISPKPDDLVSGYLRAKF